MNKLHAVVLILAMLVVAPHTSADADSPSACLEVDLDLTCYDSEEALIEANPWVSAGADGIVPYAACSSALQLYVNTGFGGTAIYLTSRLVTINLSTYGFDNVTSSYKVGACAARFYDGANLSGTQYPGATGAGASASSMVAGWDNRISSVVIL